MSALIDVSDESDRQLIRAAAAINEIPVNNIIANPYQPRSSFDETALDELVRSVEAHGIIQPITVRHTGDNRFQLVTGERRLRAARKAGLKRIPAFVRETDDENMLELALVENIQREDLDAIEVALSYQRLVDECNLTQENLADRVGKKRATVANYLRLLKLPPEIQAGIKEKKLDMGHARALIGVEDPGLQLQIFEKIVKQGLSVRAVENLVKKAGKSAEGNPGEREPGAGEYDRLRDHLSQHFGVPVEFRRNNKGAGRIVIPFATDEDLRRIVSILDKPGA